MNVDDFALASDRRVLGRLLLFGLERAEDFRLDFFSARHWTIYRHILAVWYRHRTVDEILVRESLARYSSLESIGGFEYLQGLVEEARERGDMSEEERDRSLAPEREILGRMLRRGQPEDGELELEFRCPRHQAIHAHILSVWAEHGTFDEILVAESLDATGFLEEYGGIHYLDRLVSEAAQ